MRAPPDLSFEHALSERFLAGSGPGGQNANKVATTVQLHLNVYALRLSVDAFQRLKRLAGRRWNADGSIVITAREARTREANRALARARIEALIAAAHQRTAPRVATRPSRSQRERRLTGKTLRSAVKTGRGRVRQPED